MTEILPSATPVTLQNPLNQSTRSLRPTKNIMKKQVTCFTSTRQLSPTAAPKSPSLLTMRESLRKIVQSTESATKASLLVSPPISPNKAPVLPIRQASVVEEPKKSTIDDLLEHLLTSPLSELEVQPKLKTTLPKVVECTDYCTSSDDDTFLQEVIGMRPKTTKKQEVSSKHFPQRSSPVRQSTVPTEIALSPSRSKPPLSKVTTSPRMTSSSRRVLMDSSSKSSYRNTLQSSKKVTSTRKMVDIPAAKDTSLKSPSGSRIIPKNTNCDQAKKARSLSRKVVELPKEMMTRPPSQSSSRKLGSSRRLTSTRTLDQKPSQPTPWKVPTYPVRTNAPKATPTIPRSPRKSATSTRNVLSQNEIQLSCRKLPASPRDLVAQKSHRRVVAKDIQVTCRIPLSMTEKFAGTATTSPPTTPKPLRQSKGDSSRKLLSRSHLRSTDEGASKKIQSQSTKKQGITRIFVPGRN